MDQSKRSSLTAGILLVLVGLVLVLVNFVPGIKDWFTGMFDWPIYVVGTAVLLVIIGLFTRQADMLVPACIVGGIGGILYYQNTTGDWASWSYMWALIPGFSGIGVVLAHVFSGGEKHTLREGTDAIISSIILFCIFGSIFGGFRFLGPWWPVLLIVGGLLIAFRSLFRSKKEQ
jgi:hypothetical protein